MRSAKTAASAILIADNRQYKSTTLNDGVSSDQSGALPRLDYIKEETRE
jgi:hypothetical protein